MKNLNKGYAIVNILTMLFRSRISFELRIKLCIFIVYSCFDSTSFARNVAYFYLIELVRNKICFNIDDLKKMCSSTKNRFVTSHDSFILTVLRSANQIVVVIVFEF